MSESLLKRAIALVEQLSPTERRILFDHFGREQVELTMRQTIEAEQQRRAEAGLFGKATDSWGIFPSRAVADLSFEEMQSDFKSFSTEWEEELDDVFPQD